jgi:hypothetical protein
MNKYRKKPINEAMHRGKKVNLGSPFRTPGGPKKFAVYVKTPGGGVKKVTFGDPNLRVKGEFYPCKPDILN